MRLFFIFIAFFTLSTHLHAGKLDLYLHSLAGSSENDGIRRSKPGGVHLDESDAGSLRVFVRFQGDIENLKDVGEVISYSNGVAVMKLPISSLLLLEDIEGVESVNAVKRLKPMLDVGGEAINLTGEDPSPRQLNAPPYEGLTGKNVIVGVVDTGIDFTHQDFRKSDGTTRLVGLWDQTLSSGLPPNNYTYGRACSVEDINTALGGSKTTCPSNDATLGFEPWHGSFVTGIAAGDGSDDYQYVGVAPEADIVFVKTDFDEDHVIDAMEYIKSVAEGLGRAYVINLSIGTQLGPHDGSSVLEERIDALNAIVSISSGNWGDDGIYSGGNLVNASTQDVEFNVPSYSAHTNSEDYISLDMWYDGKDKMSITVYSPNGYNATAKNGETQAESTPDGRIEIINATSGADSSNSDYEVLIEIDDESGTPPLAGRWRIVLEAEEIHSGGAYSMWIYASDIGGERAGFEGANDSRGSLGIPASAKSAIAVGSYVSKVEWTDSNGVLRSFADTAQESGGTSTFSGAGPTRDSRIKPEIVAPGEVIVSTLSSGAVQKIGVDRIMADGVHAADRGTSYASPFVAGAVALLLQKNPELTVENVRNLLMCSADKANPLGVENLPDDGAVSLGYGLLDIANAYGVLKNDVQIFSPPDPILTNTDEGYVLIEYASNEVGSADYYLQRRAETEPDFRTLGVINNAGYTDNTVNPGGAYYYRIISDNSICGRAVSKVEKILTTLTSPTNLFANMFGNKIQLSWNLVPGAIGYIVERAEANGEFDSIAFTGNNSYTDNVQTAGLRYVYRIRSYTNSTISAQTSSEMTVDTFTTQASSDDNSRGCGILMLKGGRNNMHSMNFNDFLFMLILAMPWIILKIPGFIRRMKVIIKYFREEESLFPKSPLSF